MIKHITIKTTNNHKQIIDLMDKMIEKPKVNFLDSGLKKKYTGEIDKNRFWFTWSKTLDFKQSRPIIKGQISEINSGSEIKMKIKDSTQLTLIVLSIIMLIPIIYFSSIIIKNQDYESLKIMGGIILLLVIIIAFNNWRTKNGIKKIEEEIYQIFNR